MNKRKLKDAKIDEISLVDKAATGKLFTVKEGEMIVMPANKPHSLKSMEKFKMLLVMIKK